MSDRSDESYGQRDLTLVDRAGVWLSRRAILRYLPNRADLEVLDLGCGYHAAHLRPLAARLKRAVAVDFKLSPELKGLKNFDLYEETIEGTLPKLTGQSFHVILLISVLEHLLDPVAIVEACRNLLKPGGALFINVPTWRGKSFLEFSAYRLKLSPKVEVDDHKMYYDRRDLWPLLVRAGFKPSLISLRYHKFGLNLFAVACRDPACGSEVTASARERAS